MRIIPIIILSIALTGCGFLKNKIEPVIDSTRTVKVDPRALEPCPVLSEEVTILTFEDSLIAYSNLGTMYSICANKQNDSIKIIKQFGNIK